MTLGVRIYDAFGALTVMRRSVTLNNNPSVNVTSIWQEEYLLFKTLGDFEPLWGVYPYYFSLLNSRVGAVGNSERNAMATLVDKNICPFVAERQCMQMLVDLSAMGPANASCHTAGFDICEREYYVDPYVFLERMRERHVLPAANATHRLLQSMAVLSNLWRASTGLNIAYNVKRSQVVKDLFGYTANVWHNTSRLMFGQHDTFNYTDTGNQQSQPFQDGTNPLRIYSVRNLLASTAKQGGLSYFREIWQVNVPNLASSASAASARYVDTHVMVHDPQPYQSAAYYDEWISTEQLYPERLVNYKFDLVTPLASFSFTDEKGALLPVPSTGFTVNITTNCTGTFRAPACTTVTFNGTSTTTCVPGEWSPNCIARCGDVPDVDDYRWLTDFSKSIKMNTTTSSLFLNLTDTNTTHVVVTCRLFSNPGRVAVWTRRNYTTPWVAPPPPFVSSTGFDAGLNLDKIAVDWRMKLNYSYSSMLHRKNSALYRANTSIALFKAEVKADINKVTGMYLKRIDIGGVWDGSILLNGTFYPPRFPGDRPYSTNAFLSLQFPTANESAVIKNTTWLKYLFTDGTGMNATLLYPATVCWDESYIKDFDLNATCPPIPPPPPPPPIPWFLIIMCTVVPCVGCWLLYGIKRYIKYWRKKNRRPVDIFAETDEPVKLRIVRMPGNSGIPGKLFRYSQIANVEMASTSTLRKRTTMDADEDPDVVSVKV